MLCVVLLCYPLYSCECSHYEETNDIIDNSEASQVVVYGPPGTESMCQNNQLNRLKSTVYSRVSAGAGLSPGHTPSRTQVLSIPPKDSPRVRGEVYASAPPKLTHPMPRHHRR